MSHVEQLVSRLQERFEVSVESRKDSWLVRLPQDEFVCEVTIPVGVQEWFAAVKRADDGSEVWSDWMDHYGASESELDAERADSISSFIERVLSDGIRLPLSIHAKA